MLIVSTRDVAKGFNAKHIQTLHKLQGSKDLQCILVVPSNSWRARGWWGVCVPREEEVGAAGAATGPLACSQGPGGRGWVLRAFHLRATAFAGSPGELHLWRGNWGDSD